MRREEIRKAARAYAMHKSNDNNTWFVDCLDIEEALLESAKFAYDHIETSNNQQRRTDYDSDN